MYGNKKRGAMAKRKKHKKKQNNHKSNVVKTTTKTQNEDKIPKNNEYKPNTEENIEAQATQTAVIGDVRYSLVLLGVIIAVFAVFYIALQNTSVASSVYGIIKLNNISF